MTEEYAMNKHTFIYIKIYPYLVKAFMKYGHIWAISVFFMFLQKLVGSRLFVQVQSNTQVLQEEFTCQQRYFGSSVMPRYFKSILS